MPGETWCLLTSQRGRGTLCSDKVVLVDFSPLLCFYLLPFLSAVGVILSFMDKPWDKGGGVSNEDYTRENADEVVSFEQKAKDRFPGYINDEAGTGKVTLSGILWHWEAGPIWRVIRTEAFDKLWKTRIRYRGGQNESMVWEWREVDHMYPVYADIPVCWTKDGMGRRSRGLS